MLCVALVTVCVKCVKVSAKDPRRPFTCALTGTESERNLLLLLFPLIHGVGCFICESLCEGVVLKQQVRFKSDMQGLTERQVQKNRLITVMSF